MVLSAIVITLYFISQNLHLKVGVFSPLIQFLSHPHPISGNHKSYLSFFFNKFFKKRYLFIFREREREGEREGGKHQCVVASLMRPTGDLAPQPRHVP